MFRKVKKIIPVLVMSSILLLAFSACGSGDDSDSAQEKKGKIVVGGKAFTEQVLLTKLTALYLEDKGYQVEEQGGMGSTVVRKALENDQIDLYWEYTGTALVVFHKEDAVSDPEEAHNRVKELDEQHDLIWLDRAELDNTYVIMMRQEAAEELGIKTISDLVAYEKENPGEIELAMTPEFYGREDGLPGLQDAYEFPLPEDQVVQMDAGLLYDAVRDGQVEAATGFATDGRIKGFDLVALEDDRMFFPAYNGAPVIRKSVLEENGELSELLNELAHRLDSEAIMSLNHAVDVEHEDAAQVAEEWLRSEGLIE